MTLTNEQLEQCRREFDEWWEENWNNGMDKEQCLEGFKAAWRPVPTVEEIDDIIHANIYTSPVADGNGKHHPDGITDAAQAIHRAFGGKNE